jgi:serine phosphatase RsbU (regulator of sigma subunit)
MTNGGQTPMVGRPGCRSPRSAAQPPAAGPGVVPEFPYLLVYPMLQMGRWVLLLALASAFLFGRLQRDFPVLWLPITLALVPYSLLSLMLLRRHSLSARQVLGILGADLLFIAFLVESSGGVRSLFFGFYYLVVVASGIFYHVSGGLVAAGTIAGITLLGECLRFHGLVLPPAQASMITLPYLMMAAIVAGHLTAQLEKEMLLRRETERSRLLLQAEAQSAEREMSLAREVQQAALPRVPDPLQGLEVGIRFRAAAEVGGDFYDFYQREDELGLLVGDAGGKGVPAALVATTAMHLFHTQAPQVGLERWCELFNRELEERTPATMLATAFCYRLHTLTGKGAWVNAGHPPPVLLRCGGTPCLLEDHGLMLGVAAGTQYTAAELTLQTGDILIAYTDGLTEAVGADGARTDLEPVLSHLPALASLSGEQIALELEARLLAVAEIRDDLTIVVIKKVSVDRSRTIC